MTGEPDIDRAMARLRKALMRRMQRDERAEELADRAPRPIRCGELAAYDTAALGRRLRPMLEFDGRGWRALAAEIGVTSPDLSRVMAGQDVSVAKIFAICDWAGLDPRAYYRAPRGAPLPRKRARPSFKSPASRADTPPEAAACFTGIALKQRGGS
ncbi:hypothetical protein [Mesorhizobium xinjiangense]|uniref:hypothetical protein n=1 Tax=Mesorhizobium xinjiangense TaxID=2678685 RepID=UPI0012EE8325|nr:hypothetical protein [Mesorhizobium xinjiangense]